MYVRLYYLFHPTEQRAPKTTGQIQNAQDFFEAGIAEVRQRIACFWAANLARAFGVAIR
jgi:hypothetical protein